jgi:hypothetical protein
MPHIVFTLLPLTNGETSTLLTQQADEEVATVTAVMQSIVVPPEPVQVIVVDDQMFISWTGAPILDPFCNLGKAVSFTS